MQGSRVLGKSMAKQNSMTDIHGPCEDFRQTVVKPFKLETLRIAKSHPFRLCGTFLMVSNL